MSLFLPLAFLFTAMPLNFYQATNPALSTGRRLLHWTLGWCCAVFVFSTLALWWTR